MLIDKIKEISEKWKNIISKLKDFSKDYFTVNDRKKISLLEQTFKSLLDKFNYTSKSLDYINISMEDYLPVAKKPYRDDLFYSIKFDSSASDFVRSIWAYTCSLYKVSNILNGNHPKLLMLDEPKQQDMAIGDFISLLKELSDYKNGQVLLFASFENSDETFDKATNNLNFKLNYIEDKLIKPLE